MIASGLWAAQRERARRWLQAGTELRVYPVLTAEEETAPPESRSSRSPRAGE